MHRQKNAKEVRGVELDAQTRCLHYRSALDIIAIKMMCCGIYYACKDCHEELADHPIKVWPKERWDCEAVLCGSCGAELSIAEYMETGYKCPVCSAAFNPGCRNHYHFYFGEPT
ncbi:CHY zinc finger protein [Granulicella sp. S190]|uniref:CHY zinc finger protein n=1 Tax=Granulicella sp. S190 TaxID=1747226 RepID=UPI00131CB1BF|nr:CHY zinc finger protein [Granulicella sp. S190]